MMLQSLWADLRTSNANMCGWPGEPQGSKLATANRLVTNARWTTSAQTIGDNIDTGALRHSAT